MNRIHSTLTALSAAVALSGIAPSAFAQNTMPAQQHPQSGAMTHSPPYQSMPAQGSSQQMMRSRTSSSGQVMGRHDMTGTVESVDSRGFVSVKTDAGTLRVHFPNASQHLKKGERITLHLAYTVDSASPSM
jgi:hypothetical protein